MCTVSTVCTYHIRIRYAVYSLLMLTHCLSLYPAATYHCTCTCISHQYDEAGAPDSIELERGQNLMQVTSSLSLPLPLPCSHRSSL